MSPAYVRPSQKIKACGLEKDSPFGLPRKKGTLTEHLVGAKAMSGNSLRLVDYSDSDSSRTTLDESVHGSVDGDMLDEPGGGSAASGMLDEPSGGSPGGSSAVDCTLDKSGSGSAVDCTLDEPGSINDSAVKDQSPPLLQSTAVYGLSACKTLLARVPGFPIYEKSGLTKEEYVRTLRARLENVSGNEAASEQSDDFFSESEQRFVYVSPEDEEKYLEALQQNQDLATSESSFDSTDWCSSGYSSSEDEPYQPHLGVSKNSFRRTPPTFDSEEDETDTKLSPEYVSDEETNEESEQEEEEEEEIKRPQKKQRKTQCRTPLDVPIQVLPVPEKPNWSVKKQNSMRLVENPHKLTVLSFFEQGLRGPTILFDDITEVDDDMFGKYRFLVAHTMTLGFAVCPNAVIGEKLGDLYYFAPNKKWYRLECGVGRHKEYHIPAPLSKRQTLSTLLANNYP